MREDLATPVFLLYLEDAPQAYTILPNQNWRARTILFRGDCDDIWPWEDANHQYQGPLPELADELNATLQWRHRCGGAEYLDDEVNERLEQWADSQSPYSDESFYNRPWNSEPVLNLERVWAHQEDREYMAWSAANPISQETIDFLEDAERVVR